MPNINDYTFAEVAEALNIKIDSTTATHAVSNSSHQDIRNTIESLSNRVDTIQSNTNQSNNTVWLLD